MKSVTPLGTRVCVGFDQQNDTLHTSHNSVSHRIVSYHIASYPMIIHPRTDTPLSSHSQLLFKTKTKLN